MPAARISSDYVSGQFLRDSQQQIDDINRSQHPQTMSSSQASQQKISDSSAQFLYQHSNNNHLQNQQQPTMMQLPQSSQPSQVIQQNLMAKADSMSQYNQMSAQQGIAVGNLTLQNMLSQQPLNSINGGFTNNNSHNGISGSTSNLNQSTILMPNPIVAAANKNFYKHPQSIYTHYIQQQQQQQTMPQSSQQQHQLQPQQQQQILAGAQQQQSIQLLGNHQQQVPMTTIMIPASTANQLQNVAQQIQQTALQSAPNLLSTPQIMVFMIPYMMNPQIPSMTPVTPEINSLNSTLVRQSNSNSSMMRQSHPQAQQAPPSNPSQSRAVSSLSNRTLTPKQEPDKFYIRANFTFQPTRNRQELAFQKGDILHVLDTLQNNDYGIQYWLATRVKPNGEDAEKGLIPNKTKAEEITLEQRTLDISERNSAGSTNTLDASASNNNGTSGVLSASVSRVNFLKRRSAQRSKSLCKGNWDNVIFDIGNFRMQTYERVIFKHPGFCRPVVIFGPLSDLARDKLLKDYPERYSYPSGISQTPGHPKVIRLKGILDIIDQGKHALLDITAQAVERLNYVNLAPIVIFMKTDSKSIIKEFRSRAAKSIDPNARDEDTLRRDGKSSRKLLEQSAKLEKQWFHVFTAVLDLSTMGSEMWYRKLRETIENQQSSNVWMGEKKSEKKLAAVAGPNSEASASGANPKTSDSQHLYSGQNGSKFNMGNGINLDDPQHHSINGRSVADGSGGLSERFSENLNISSTKSTNDLQQNQQSIDSGLYGNRSQLRNAYAHSLAQRLARASSEPKLNGLMSDNEDGGNLEEDDDEDDDDDDDDEIIKKPLFPSEFENTSSISSSNGGLGGIVNFGQCSLVGTTPSSSQLPNMHQQQSSHYHLLMHSQGKPPAPLPPQVSAQQDLSSDKHHHQLLPNQPVNRQTLAQNQDNIYSMNGGDPSAVVTNTAFANASAMGPPVIKSQHNQRSDYHTLPPLASDSIYNGHQQHNQLQSGFRHNNTSATHQMGNTASSINGLVPNNDSSSVNNQSSSSNNILDLTRNHEARGSAFQIFSDMNQNNYHYYNINKIQ